MAEDAAWYDKDLDDFDSDVDSSFEEEDRDDLGLWNPFADIFNI